MRPQSYRLVFAALAAAALVGHAAVSRAEESVWEIDPSHSAAQFSVRHMMVSNVRGEFGKVSGTVHTQGADLSKAVVEATIDTTTINTREPGRDKHLKSPDFFDVEKYPTITFKSKRVQVVGKGKLKITGDLTIHGVTKEVALDVMGPTPEVKDPWGAVRMGASATTKVSRKDFGLKWNKALDGGGVVVGEDVQINLDVELKKKPAGSAPSQP